MPGTKQLRLSDIVQIKSRVRELLHKKINIVLKDNTVMFGELKEVNENGISLRNMRLKTIVYPFDQIAEIYFDILV